MNFYISIFNFLFFLKIQICLSQVKIDKISQKTKNKEKLDIKTIEKDQFEKQIESFTLGEFQTFEISPQSGEYIYYNISNPCILTFAFYLSDIEKYISLNFKGPDPSNEISLDFKNKNFLYYEYKLEKIGKYVFYLNNENKEKIQISFAIKDSWNKDNNIGTKKLDTIVEYIDEMESKINKIRLRQDMINKKTDAHNEGVNKHNKSILINSFVEILTMIIILVIQLYYIKKNISKI